MIHVINANRYSVSPAVIDAGTKGSYGNDYLRLALSSDWDGLIVKISYYPKRSQPVVVVCNDIEEIPIPDEVYDHAGDVIAVISGERSSRSLISLPFMLRVTETKTPANTPARTPTPTEMAQIYEYMRQAVEVSESVRADADSGMFNGISPTVEVEALPGDNGYKIIITDINGENEIILHNGGSPNYIIGSGLKLDPYTNTLSVDTAEKVEEDNTKPITSAAVYETVGNINALLATI